MNYFNSFEHLEPKCPGCSVKIEYGTSTRYSNKRNGQICLTCDTLL